MFILHPVTSVPDHLLKCHKQWERGLITLITLIKHAARFLSVEHEDTMDAINTIEKITNPIHVFFKVASDAEAFKKKFDGLGLQDHLEPPDWIMEKELLECKWITVNVPSADVIDYLRENAKPVYTEVCDEG